MKDEIEPLSKAELESQTCPKRLFDCDGRQMKGKSPFLFLFTVVCFLLVACQSVIPERITVQVEQIINGQDFEVTGAIGQPEITERVRLEGIAVPDLAQHPWGEAASAQLKQLVGKTVMLESDAEPRDPSGRRLAYVWHDRVLLNEKLVSEGLARVVPHSPNHKYDNRLIHAQDRARVLELGIWDPKNPLREEPRGANSRE